MQQQQQEHAQKIAQQKDALRKVLDENRKMKIAKDQIDKQIRDLEGQVSRLHETETQLAAEWVRSMEEIEAKVAQMKGAMTITFEQLRENLKLLNQYKVKVQTISIRIKIEQKVKSMNTVAQFEQRKVELTSEIAKAKDSQR